MILEIERIEARKRLLHVATTAFYNAITIIDVEAEELFRAGKLESDEDLSDTVHAAFMAAIAEHTTEEEAKGPAA